MADREKVIKGMELCIPPYQCSPADCPYYSSPNNESGLTWHCWDRLITDALALLKEQKAKPVVDIADSIDGIEVGRCPSCDRAIVNKKSDPTRFCKFCGHEVNWDG